MEIRSTKKCLLCSGYFFIYIKQCIFYAIFIKYSCNCIDIRVFSNILNINSNNYIFPIALYV